VGGVNDGPNAAPYVVSASIGVASIEVASGDHTDAGELLRNADVALCQANAAGKGRSASFEVDVQLDPEDRVELERDLRAAVDRAEFFLAYQPHRLKQLGVRIAIDNFGTGYDRADSHTRLAPRDVARMLPSCCGR
jgi:predicted signal transduction protein with EAL and GGDEF domain